jgi:hypothetical protein
VVWSGGIAVKRVQAARRDTMSQNAHLTNVEAQRIMAVLDELSVDLRLVFAVTPQVCAQRTRL